MEEGFDLDPALPESEDAAVVRHQPPSPADLRRNPPDGARCEQVRGLLRSYADRETSIAEGKLVEDHVHVHNCRPCAVALSRVEAEVYRVRRAFEVPAAAARVPADFVRNVMTLVHAEKQAEKQDLGDRPRASDAPDLSVDFTPRVMERIRREWRHPSVAGRLVAAARQHGFWLLGAAAAAAFLLWLGLGAPNADPGIHVFTAEGGTLARSGRAAHLVAGEVLRPRDQIRLDAARGRATLVVPRADQTVDRVELDPGVEMSVLADAAVRGVPLFRLDFGSMTLRVNSREPMSFVLAGEVEITLETGVFNVYVEPVVRHDGELARESFQGVRLAALQGRASIRRGSNPPTSVESGSVALFDGWSAVAFERWLSDAEIAASWGRRDLAIDHMAATPAPTLDDWLGRVINGRTNAGVAGVAVTVRRLGQTTRTVFTADDGTFRLEKFGDTDGAIALVDLTLPEGGAAASLANVANFAGPILLRATGVGPRGERRLDPIRLPAERQVMGTVLDPDGRPVFGASVTPVLADTLAGSTKRLTSLVGVAITGPDGRFRLRRLPAAMPPHVDIFLLVEHAQHGAVAALDLLLAPSGRDHSIAVIMGRRERVRLTDLPRGQPITILASIRNLAPSTMLEVMPAVVPASGVVELEVAEGASLWLRNGSDLVALAAQPDRAGAWQQLEEQVPARIAALATQEHHSSDTVLERGTWRYDALMVGGVERRTVALMDREGHDLAGARVFLAPKDGGAMSYLGEMSAAQADWALPSQADYRVVVVTDEGAVGVVDANELQENMLRVRVLAPGSARLPDEIISDLQQKLDARGGFAVFELRMVTPLSDYVVYRPTGRDSRWEMHGLVPGIYRLATADSVTWQVEVPAGGVATFGRL